MNKKEKNLSFGRRRVQKTRFTHMVVIPKALIRALGIKEGDNIEFTLNKENHVFFQIEEEEQ